MMKKPIIAFVLLLAAAAASVGAYLGVKKNKEKEDKKQIEELQALVLFNFDSESINKIEFKCGDGDYTVELKDDIWSLTSGDTFPLDQDYLQLVCTYTSTLAAESSYDDANFAQYGLDSPDTVTLYNDTNSYKLYIGDVSPTGDYYYLAVDGSEKVYIVSSTYGSIYKADKMMLKSKDFLPYKTRDIAEITVTRGDELGFTVKYDKDNDYWSIPEEYSALTYDLTNVTTMVTNLTRLSAGINEMLDDNLTDLSKYGFDKPTAKAVFKGLDGSTYTYLFNDKFDKKGVYTYALLVESGQVMMFSKYDVDFIYYTPLDFLLKTMPLMNIATVTDIDFEFGDIKELYTVNTKENKASVGGHDIDLSNGSLNVAFRNFFSSLATLNITELDVKAEPELTDPLVTAVFTLDDGTTTTYQLTDAGDGKCYAFINGKYTGALTTSDKIKGINSLDDFHKRLLKELGIE